jgi:hypothetical protein
MACTGRKGRAEFEAACLNSLRAFQSKPELAEQFDQLFGGTEVLPETLVEEYQKGAEDPLVASELLVPISYRQLLRLRREGKILKREDGIFVAQLAYSSDAGLEL